MWVENGWVLTKNMNVQKSWEQMEWREMEKGIRIQKVTSFKTQKKKVGNMETERILGSRHSDKEG